MASKETRYLTVEEETQFIKQYQETSCPRSLQILIDNNMDLVCSLARKKRRYLSIEFDDLVQEGIIGLVKAINNFDINSDNRLVTYARYYIENGMYEFIMANANPIRFSTNKNNKKIFFNMGKYRNSNGVMTHEAINRMAEELSVPVKNINDMNVHLTSVYFDHSSLFEDEEFGIPDSYHEPLEVCERNEKLNFAEYGLESALSEFDDRMLDIVKQRYLQDEPTPLTELASKYGVSHQRIKQIEDAALVKLKQNFEQNSFYSA